MNDNPKEPEKRIQFRRKDEPEKNKFQFRPEDDQRTVTDKDNTGFRFDPPDKSQHPAPNLAPGGQMGNRSRPASSTNDQEKMIIEFTPEGYEEQPVSDAEINLDRTDIDLEYQNKGLNVLVRKDPEPTEHGIDGGQITRLTVTEGDLGNETVLAHFDNGKWEKQPDTFVEKEVVQEAKQQDNGIEIEFKRPSSDLEYDP